MSQHLRLYFDGSCEPRNPGGVATYGWIILGDGDLVVYIGKGEHSRGPGATNNVAEYAALEDGLLWLAGSSDRDRAGGTLGEILGDSKLVVNQVNGTWRCNHAHLQRHIDRCRELIDQVAPGTRLTWIPREENEFADSLSRLAYEKATGKKFPERRRK